MLLSGLTEADFVGNLQSLHSLAASSVPSATYVSMAVLMFQSQVSLLCQPLVNLLQQWTDEKKELVQRCTDKKKELVQRCTDEKKELVHEKKELVLEIEKRDIQVKNLTINNETLTDLNLHLKAAHENARRKEGLQTGHFSVSCFLDFRQLT
jgi:hypothetical protein